MGYFFFPRVMVSVGDQNVRKAIADVMEKPFLKNNKYTIAPFPREEDSGQFSAMWRWWGCFIHHEGFKPVIDELFTIRHDPETYDELSGDYDDYEGDAIWVKNCVDQDMKYCIKIFKQLWDLIKIHYPEWIDIANTTSNDFKENVVASVKFIILSEYTDGCQ